MTYGALYKAARAQAIKRSGGTCQGCGNRPATETHHWQWAYSPEDQIRPEHLTALCGICHYIFTTLRQYERTGGNIFKFKQLLEETLCDIKSK